MDNETREMFSTLFDMMKNMQADINGLRGEVHDLRGLIENETNKNIKIIAEGHQMQVDKLNDIQKVVENVRAKQELTDIRLNLLEAEVKHLKRA